MTLQYPEIHSRWIQCHVGHHETLYCISIPAGPINCTQCAMSWQLVLVD